MRIPEPIRNLIGPVELIHAQAGPRLLHLARIGIILLWIIKLLLDPLWRLAALPPELFRPVGIIALLPAPASQWLTPGWLIAFYVITLVVLAACLTQRAFLVTATLAAILLSAYSSIIRGFGPSVHTDITLLLAVYALAAFAWADWLQIKLGASPKARATWSSYPLVTIVAMLCLTYTLVGLNRAVSGGARVFTGDTMEVWAIDAGLRGYYFNTNLGWHLPQWPVIAFMVHSGLPAVTFFEITAPLCLAWPHYRWVFIPFMLSFHLLSLVLMNIFFFDDMLLYLLLIDWSKRFPALRAP